MGKWLSHFDVSQCWRNSILPLKVIIYSISPRVRGVDQKLRRADIDRTRIRNSRAKSSEPYDDGQALGIPIAYPTPDFCRPDHSARRERTGLRGHVPCLIGT
jgi:hypothetical protein